MEPMGQSLANSEIFRRLAAAMGFQEPELFGTDRDVIARVLDDSGIGLDFAGLAERGTVWVGDEPRVQFADLRFPTPSGRIELASRRAQHDGAPRTPRPLADARPGGDRLRLLTPASALTLNDSFGNDPKLRRRLGAATVALHPADAAARGMTEGDSVLVASEAGELALTLTLFDGLPRGVAYAPKGRWPKLEPGRANVNVLNPGGRSDLGQSTTVHAVEVTVRPRATAVDGAH
jgi:anaerobic selenocysteine-containing dehydrogenase